MTDEQIQDIIDNARPVAVGEDFGKVLLRQSIEALVTAFAELKARRAAKEGLQTQAENFAATMANIGNGGVLGADVTARIEAFQNARTEAHVAATVYEDTLAKTLLLAEQVSAGSQ